MVTLVDRERPVISAGLNKYEFNQTGIVFGHSVTDALRFHASFREVTGK